MKKKRMSNKTFRRITIPVMAVVLAALIVGNVAAYSYRGLISTHFNHDTFKIVETGEDVDSNYFPCDFSSEEELNEHNGQVAQNIESEGLVLLENNGGLPLNKGDKVSVFSVSSVNIVYGGAGSGSVDTSTAPTLKTALEKSGLSVNPTLWDFYTKKSEDGYQRSAPNWRGGKFSINEVPWADVASAAQSSFDEYSDAAIVVISRSGGEGSDLTAVNFAETAGVADNSGNYLELSTEEADMLKAVNDQFDDVVVVLNANNAMELGWLSQYPNIKAAIWAGGVGQTGLYAIADALVGDVVPSGRLVDTYAADANSSPAAQNAGTNFWIENGFSNESDQYIVYEEGIYVGYRYYETRYEDVVLGQGNAGDYDYASEVIYPFGRGLSYTTFTQTLNSVTEADGTITVDVTVTNTGSASGKEVVEVYYNPPYTNGGIEKASANLIGFAKTSELAPGASENVTVTFKAEDMASYDTYGKGCYVLEKGDYVISINADSHTVLDSKVYNVASDIVYDASNKRESDVEVADNKFDFAEGNVTYLSRADGFANYAEATAAPADFELPAEAKAAFYNNSNWNPEDFNNADDVAPTTGAKNGLKLKDMVGVDYNDAQWDAFLDQLTVADMDSLIALGGYQSVAVDSIGKVQAVDCDGPASINNNFTKQGSIGFPSAVMIAATWNTDLAHDFGTSIGKMADDMDVSGWYAPAMNIHRSAFAGRNFEYYSEDGVLSGAMAANAIMGSQEQGVYAFMKHFALNDQETNRCGMLCTWSNEQAIREIYLKPFEHCVKAADCHAVMSSFNYVGNTYAGNCSALLNDVLRGEWGFVGMVLTDYYGVYGYQDSDRLIRNGGDFCLVNYDTETNHLTDTTSATALVSARQACKNILYTVANSRAYYPENLNPGMPGWEKVMIGVDVVLAAALIALEVLVVKKGYAKRKEEEVNA